MQKDNDQLISSSLAFCGIIFFLFIILNRILRSSIGGGIVMLYADGMLRFLISIPCIIVLGKIIQDNGFKFSLSTKGFKKGMFAHLFFLLWIFLRLPLFFTATEINIEFIPAVPAIIFFDLANGIFEEVLFRGILMTAILIQFGETVRGRIFSVVFSGIVFGLIHLYGGNFLTVLFTGLIGMGFAAAYVYSKNLLSCIIVHALWNYAMKIPNVLIADVNNAGLWSASQMIMYISLVAILLFAIILTIKAEPHFNVYKQFQ